MVRVGVRVRDWSEVRTEAGRDLARHDVSLLVLLADVDLLAPELLGLRVRPRLHDLAHAHVQQRERRHLLHLGRRLLLGGGGRLRGGRLSAHHAKRGAADGQAGAHHRAHRQRRGAAQRTCQRQALAEHRGD
eukprot:scaffold16997_cov57-Phaeocystis_antarctica.AAC.3